MRSDKDAPLPPTPTPRDHPHIPADTDGVGSRTSLRYLTSGCLHDGPDGAAAAAVGALLEAEPGAEYLWFAGEDDVPTLRVLHSDFPRTNWSVLPIGASLRAAASMGARASRVGTTSFDTVAYEGGASAFSSLEAHRPYTLLLSSAFTLHQRRFRREAERLLARAAANAGGGTFIFSSRGQVAHPSPAFAARHAPHAHPSPFI